MASIDISDKLLAEVFGKTFTKKLLEELIPITKAHIEEEIEKCKIKDKEMLSRYEAAKFLGVGDDKFQIYLSLGLPQTEIEAGKPKYSKTLMLEFIRKNSHRIGE